MTGELFDTHCHLTLPAFGEDLPQVLERAAGAGVGRILTIGIDLPSSRDAVALAARARDGQAPALLAAVGIHPHDSGQWTRESRREIRALAASPSVVALGETGLDYYRDHAPRETQRRVFEDTLSLAEELRRPVVVHIREAHRDALAILTSFVQGGARVRGVLHCFSGGPEEAARAGEMGFYLAFGGSLTYRRPPVDALRAAPRERLLLETDAPYLPPVPHRGRRNESSYLPLVARAMAEALGESVEDVQALTTANACRLFGVP